MSDQFEQAPEAQQPKIIEEIAQDVSGETMTERSIGGGRKIIALAAVAVLLVAGGAGAGYWYFVINKKAAPESPKQEQQKQVEQITQDETAGWATYANTILQYSIKYPADKFEVINPSVGVLSKEKKIENSEQVFFKEKGTEEMQGIPTSAKGFYIGFEKTSKEAAKSLEGFRKFTSIENTATPGRWKLGQEVVFGSNRGIEATECSFPDSCSTEVYFFSAVIFDPMLQIAMSFPKNPDIGSLPDIYKQMLSTFTLAQSQSAACDKACLEDKFTRCEAGAADIAVNDQLVYHDEIVEIDPSFGLCIVKVSFTKNPNPDLLGKEMVCWYDNKLPFSEAVKDIDRCKGPLNYILTGRTVGRQPVNSYQEVTVLFAEALIKKDIDEALKYVVYGAREKQEQMLKSIGLEGVEFRGHTIKNGAALATTTPQDITDQTSTIEMRIPVFDAKGVQMSTPIVLRLLREVGTEWYVVIL